MSLKFRFKIYKSNFDEKNFDITQVHGDLFIDIKNKTFNSGCSISYGLILVDIFEFLSSIKKILNKKTVKFELGPPELIEIKSYNGNTQLSIYNSTTKELWDRKIVNKIEFAKALVSVSEKLLKIVLGKNKKLGENKSIQKFQIAIENAHEVVKNFEEKNK